MKNSDPESWRDACDVDERLRANQKRLRLELTPYLHRSLQPLAQVDLRSWAEKGQPDLFQNECEGMCSV
jgi:hypothetical protein